MNSITLNSGLLYLIIISLLFSVIAVLYLLVKMFVFEKKFKILFQGKNAESLEDKIILCLKRVQETAGNNDVIIRKLREMKLDLDSSLKKLAIVRYNPFAEVGSNQSFSMCLLDSQNNGVIISGLYQRGINNIYLKEVKSGATKNTLSEEEEDVLKKAINSNR